MAPPLPGESLIRVAAMSLMQPLTSERSAHWSHGRIDEQCATEYQSYPYRGSIAARSSDRDHADHVAHVAAANVRP